MRVRMEQPVNEHLIQIGLLPHHRQVARLAQQVQLGKQRLAQVVEESLQGIAVATSLPSRSRARCTCANDAAATGSASKLSNALDSRTPSSRVHDSLHLREREGLHAVLQAAQRLHVQRVDQIGPGRKELTQLDESGPHRLQVAGQGVRVAFRWLHGSARARSGLHSAIGMDDLRTVMPDQQPDDVLVSLEVFLSER